MGEQSMENGRLKGRWARGRGPCAYSPFHLEPAPWTELVQKWRITPELTFFFYLFRRFFGVRTPARVILR